MPAMRTLRSRPKMHYQAVCMSTSATTHATTTVISARVFVIMNKVPCCIVSAELLYSIAMLLESVSDDGVEELHLLIQGAIIGWVEIKWQLQKRRIGATQLQRCKYMQGGDKYYPILISGQCTHQDVQHSSWHVHEQE